MLSLGLVNNELETMQKETDMIRSEVLSRHLQVGTEINKGNPN
jgi:hypothetical protein